MTKMLFMLCFLHLIQVRAEYDPNYEPTIFTIRGRSEEINAFINKFDVLRRDRRETEGLETTRVLVTSRREERALEDNIKGTPVSLSERRFNLTACLEAQSRWKRTAGFDYERYHQLHEIHQWMDDVAAKHPDKVEVFDISLSFENRPLKAFKISTGSADSSTKPAVWIDGGIHAREWISPATVIYFVKTILDEYNTNSTIKWMLDTADWFVLPVFNVDGYIYSWEQDRMWRKTRSTQPGTDCVGADPNRNWDHHWKEAASSNDPCSNNYMGSKPFSEMEVRDVAGFIAKHPEIKMYLTYHNAGQKYIIPWGYTSAKIPDYDELMSACKKGVDAVESVKGQPYVCDSVTGFFGILPGVSNDYVYGKLGVKHSYAVELRDQSDGYYMGYYFCLPEEQIVDTAEENFAGLVTLFRESKITEHIPYQRVSDSQTGVEPETSSASTKCSSVVLFVTAILIHSSRQYVYML